MFKMWKKEEHAIVLKPHENNFLYDGCKDITNGIMCPDVFIAM
jgi:hypothetical protein